MQLLIAYTDKANDKRQKTTAKGYMVLSVVVNW